MAEKMVPRMAEDLLYHKTIEGEDHHDYEIINLWYDPDGLTPTNISHSVKCRCRNCGRIVTPSATDMIQLEQNYKNSNYSHSSDFDFAGLVSDYDFYILPRNCGPFDIKYIYDDGTMKIEPLDKGAHNHLQVTEDIHMVKVDEL